MTTELAWDDLHIALAAIASVPQSRNVPAELLAWFDDLLVELPVDQQKVAVALLRRALGLCVDKAD